MSRQMLEREIFWYWFLLPFLLSNQKFFNLLHDLGWRVKKYTNGGTYILDDVLAEKKIFIKGNTKVDFFSFRWKKKKDV